MNQVSEYLGVGEDLWSVQGNYNMDKVIIHTSYGNFTVGIVAMRVKY